MPIVSTGQITIVDYHDAVSLTGFIGANQGLTQIYNPDNATYSPSWSSSNLILTPSLFVSGSASDVIATTAVKSIKWFDGTTEITSGGSYSLPAFTSGQNRKLTITGNILSGSTTAKTFVVEIVYTDTSTGLDLTYKTSISVSRINNGGGVTIAVASTPSGNVIKNGTGTLTAKGELLRSSGVDTTAVSYQWYKQDSSVVTDEGGGIGWNKLTSTDTGGGTTGYTSNTLTIPPNAIAGLATFKVEIKDTDSASPTYNQKFYDTVTVIDQTDNIQVTITSSGGDVFKNGIGSTTLTAKVFQAGIEVDTAGTKYTYTWKKYDSNGNLVGAYSKTGKTNTVGSADVDAKATFVVELT